MQNTKNLKSYIMKTETKVKQLEKKKKALQLKAFKVKTMKEWNDISNEVREINSEIDYIKFWNK